MSVEAVAFEDDTRECGMRAAGGRDYTTTTTLKIDIT